MKPPCYCGFADDMDISNICFGRLFRRFTRITLPKSLLEKSIINRKAAQMEKHCIKIDDGNKENAPLYPDKIEKEVY